MLKKSRPAGRLLTTEQLKIRKVKTIEANQLKGKVAAALLLILGIWQTGISQPGAGWKLIWRDEFNYNGKPDGSKWGFAPRGRADWACYCTADTATAVVKDDRLILKGILSKDPADTATYQTGCVQTRNKFYFTYGKLEVRAKLAKGQGSWPAIWLMPQESKYGGWPQSGEIDVMEQLNRDTIFYQTLHSTYIDRLQQKKNPPYFATAPFNDGDFNVFGMEWYPDRIDFFVNEKKTFSYPKLANDTTGTQWPFDQNFYIILNQALGGKWPGPVKAADLPVQMEVDYVRVYQKKE